MQTKLELYQKVTPLAHLGIWERNVRSGEIYWNSVIRQIYEVDESFDPLVSNSTNFYLDQLALSDFIELAIKSGKPHTIELQLRSAKGNIKWVKVRAQASFENNECSLLYGTLEDITNDIRLNEQLAAQEAQFHQAFEHAPIGMALVSPQGGFLRVNKILCKILGFKKQNLLENTFQSLTFPDDLDRDLTLMNQLLEGEIDSYHLDKRYLHKNKSVIWASLHVTLVRDRNGKPLYFISQVVDITERKKMEIERVRTMEIIGDQNARLLNFAHIVSHNLRSHTANIQMIADMIIHEKDDAERNLMIQMLASSSINLQDTLAHLNEVVDVHARGKERIKRLNLLKVVSKNVSVISTSLKSVNGYLDIQIPKDIEISYDQAYLDSVVLNLLTNAIKYRSPTRDLIIKITALNTSEHVIMQVEDNGIGIDLNKNGQKLFGMYNTFHGNSDARGIGLFLVKNQVEVMGGRIAVSSTPNQGTTFTIEFN